MGIFDKIKNAFSAINEAEAQFEQAISNSLEEHIRKSDYSWGIEVNKFDIYQTEIVHWPNDKKIDFAIYCIRKIQTYSQQTSGATYNDKNYKKNAIREAYLKHLFKTKLIFVDTDVKRFQELLSQVKKWDWNALHTWPV